MSALVIWCAQSRIKPRAKVTKVKTERETDWESLCIIPRPLVATLSLISISNIFFFFALSPKNLLSSRKTFSCHLAVRKTIALPRNNLREQEKVKWGSRGEIIGVLLFSVPRRDWLLHLPDTNFTTGYKVNEGYPAWSNKTSIYVKFFFIFYEEI